MGHGLDYDEMGGTARCTTVAAWVILNLFESLQQHSILCLFEVHSYIPTVSLY